MLWILLAKLTASELIKLEYVRGSSLIISSVSSDFGRPIGFCLRVELIGSNFAAQDLIQYRLHDLQHCPNKSLH